MNRRSSTPEKLSLGVNIAWNTVGSLVYVVCNWLITVLVVVLGSDLSASGDLALAMSVGNVVATIVLFKVRPVQVSDLEERFSQADYVGFRFVSIAIAALFVSGYILLTIRPGSCVPVCLYVLFKMVDSFVDVYHGVDQRNDHLDYPGISQILRGVLMVVAFSFGLFLFHSLNLAIFLMAVISFLVVATYDHSRASRFCDVSPSFTPVKMCQLLKTCFPGFIASLLCTMVVSFARQEYGSEYGSELLGIYAAVATPTVIVQAVAGYIYAPLLVPIARAVREGKHGDVARFICKYLALLLVIVISAVVLFGIFGETALSIVYGDHIARYHQLFTPIIVATGSTAGMMFLQDVLVVYRKYFHAAFASGLSLALCAVVVRPLLVSFGMNGISFSITLAYCMGIGVSGMSLLLGGRSHLQSEE